jgi:Histone acetyl transferase HAT1 N-terminus
LGTGAKKANGLEKFKQMNSDEPERKRLRTSGKAWPADRIAGSNDVLRFHLAKIENGAIVEDSTFAPEFSHQVFGEDEEIKVRGAHLDKTGRCGAHLGSVGI